MPSKPTRIHLVRHAHSTANERGILAGQASGVSLSQRGVQEAHLLTSALKELNLSRLVLSPLLRVRQTVRPFVKEMPHLSPIISPGLIEMDYGLWSGKKLSTLSKRSLWGDIQRRPSSVTFPSGESFLQMSARANQAVSELAATGKNTCFVSHGDVIKAIVVAQLGLSVDALQSLVIEPASITTLIIGKEKSILVRSNDTSHLRRQMRDQKGYVLGGGE